MGLKNTENQKIKKQQKTTLIHKFPFLHSPIIGPIGIIELTIIKLTIGLVIALNLAFKKPSPTIHSATPTAYSAHLIHSARSTHSTHKAQTHSIEQMKTKDILNDTKKRITKRFKISSLLKKRVSFWFNIYTKYDSQSHIIHHTKYPWIVFDVLNTKDIINGPGHHWTKYHRAKKAVSQQALQVKSILRRLAYRKNYKNLRGIERKLYNSLKKIRGKRKHVFLSASKNVRTQLGQKDFFLKGIESSTKYMAYMEEIFRKKGLPIELTRLPLVESSFNEKAHSKVGASGIWQIMPRTAKEHIHVTKYIDERNSPIKATHLAARIFKQYHRNLKSWPITVTAYNHGVGGMKKTIKAAKTKRIDKIINYRKKKHSLGFASRNFYTSFLAALYAEKYQNEIFHNEIISQKPLRAIKPIRLKKRMKVQYLVKKLGISKEKLMNYNPDLKWALKKNAYLPRRLEVHLPLEHKYNKKNLQEIAYIHHQFKSINRKIKNQRT